MMNIHLLSVSMILIVLSLVHINALKHQSNRQIITDSCQYPNLAFCEFIQCENGQCIENKASADCFTCQCSVGFTGRLCETSIATSSGCNPACQNGGQCQQTITNTYACVCPQEYTGNQCETSVLATHPCVTMPGSVCQNGGTCTINGSDYLCNCPTGWSGTNCERQDTVTACDPNPCGAHGNCLQVILPTGELAVYCQCEAQWTGKYCDNNLATTCVNGFCQSGGICQMNGNTPYCICPSTHTGQQCETLIGASTTTTTTGTITVTPIFTTTDTSTGRTTLGACTSSSCLNGGSCFNTGNDFICLCKPQFSGPTCSLQNAPTTPLPTTPSSANPCSPNPCNNGGACYKYGNDFVCVCTTQYAGQTCDMAKTTTTPTITTSNPGMTCANQPCQNGATCYNAGNSYFCYCGATGFSGKNCELTSK